jgi:hypothetical protein
VCSSDLVLFTERKKALMNRDPLVKDLMEKLMSYDPKKDKPPKEQMEQLKQQIEQKWNVGIVVTWAAQPYVYGGFEVNKESPELPLSPVRTNLPHDGEVRIEPLLIFNRTKGYPVSSLPKHPFEYHLPINPSDNIITIQVNLDLIDQNDASLVKNAVWEIVKKQLPARKGKKEIPREPRELNSLYDYRQKTFDNYVRWYDLHIGTDYDKPNGFSFRAIAYGEDELREHPESYEDTMKEVANRTKVVRSVRGERVLKGVIGEPVRGEDTVGKGVVAIYKAIHRKPYPSKKTKLKEYNCPTHGVSCPTMECPYAKNFMKRFNKRTMLFKPLYTIDPAVLPQVIGEGGLRSKRKPTADQQSNTK